MPEGTLDTITKLIQSPPRVLAAFSSAGGHHLEVLRAVLTGGGDREPDCPRRIVVGQFSPVSKRALPLRFRLFAPNYSWWARTALRNCVLLAFVVNLRGIGVEQHKMEIAGSNHFLSKIAVTPQANNHYNKRQRK
jgi:hypothetical protein